MRKESLEFLAALLAAPSPAGFEQPVQRVIRETVADWVDELHTDVHGNVLAVKNPTGQPRVMLAGHCDQIGFMIQHVTDEGYVHFSAIGGVDAVLVPGSRMTIWAAGGPVLGVVGRKPIHLLKDEERKKAETDLSKLWLDIGAAGKDRALKRVQIGDPITFELRLDHLSADLVTAPGFDDKAGTFVVMEALRLLRRRRLPCALYSVSTVQEELGLRGARTSAYGIDPQVGIAVDVTFGSDHPGVDKAVTGELKLGAGPALAKGGNINPVLFDLLVRTARDHKIPYQVEPAPRATGTDANVIQITRAGVAAGLVSIPTRYIHTQVEVASLRDMVNAARLLAETVARLDGKLDFTPR